MLWHISKAHMGGTYGEHISIRNEDLNENLGDNLGVWSSYYPYERSSPFATKPTSPAWPIATKSVGHNAINVLVDPPRTQLSRSLSLSPSVLAKHERHSTLPSARLSHAHVSVDIRWFPLISVDILWCPSACRL